MKMFVKLKKIDENCNQKKGTNKMYQIRREIERKNGMKIVGEEKRKCKLQLIIVNALEE